MESTLTFDDVEYHFYQMHCHTGSEHTVNERQYPGECHFVHRSESGLEAVIGIFLDDSLETSNPFFSMLLDLLAQDELSGESEELFSNSLSTSKRPDTHY